VGACIIGQSAFHRAGRQRIYALRDVTATVESIPAHRRQHPVEEAGRGIDGLVLDVKSGAAPFMENRKQAHRLAETSSE